MFGTELNVSCAGYENRRKLITLPRRQKITTIFTCGYVVGMIPSNEPFFSIQGNLHRSNPLFWKDNLMLQVVRPRIWLPTMQVIWGVLTFW